MPAPFVIFSLPRSRSAWLAYWLGQQGRKIGHDIAIECKSSEDFLASFKNGMLGTVETGAILGWQLLRARMPGLKIVLVRRSLPEVYISLAKFGVLPLPGELERREVLLDFVSSLPGVRSIDFWELGNPARAAWLWEYLLEIPFDAEWFRKLNPVNIQIDMKARLEQLERNHLQLEEFKASVLLETSKLQGADRCQQLQ